MSNVPSLVSGNARHNLPLGTAQWLTFPDDARPVYERGQVVLGHLPTGEPVGYRDDTHCLVCARTGMGKGTTFIVPNLIHWHGSLFVIDPKGENARITARQRGMGSAYVKGAKRKVYLLDPFQAVKRQDDDFEDLRVGFNPLDLLRKHPEEMLDDAARIAEALIVSDQSSDPFWDDAAKMVLRSLILHVATWDRVPDNEHNLATVRRLLLEGERVADDLGEVSGLRVLFDSMSANPALDGVIASAGRMLADIEEKSPRTAGSVFQVAITNTNFIDSPQMKKCLSTSGFALSELKEDPRGISVYVCLPDRFVGEHFRWLRMITSLTIAEMERVDRAPATGYPVLTILDEFAALKRMRHLETAAAQIRSYGMKLVFVVQSLAQLKDVYKDNWETFVANCGVKLFWGNDDLFTREYVSKMLGDIEVSREGASSNHSEGSSDSSSWSHGVTNGVSSTSGSSWNSQGGWSDSSSSTVSTSESNTTTRGSSASKSHSYGRSESVHRRPLLSPEEVGRVFGDPHAPRALGLITGRPIYLHRWAYFQLPDLRGFYEPHKYDGKVPTLTEVAALKHREEEQRKLEAQRQRAIAAARAEARQEAMRKAEEERALLLYEAALREEEAAVKRRAQMRRDDQAMLVARVVVFILLPIVLWYILPLPF